MKRYPRTLNEAFPNTAEYGAAIKKYYREQTLADRVMAWMSIAIMIVVVLDLFVWRP